MTWGVEPHIVERFEKAGVAKDNISMEKDTFLFRAPDKSPAEVIELLREFYGPTMNAFDAADKNGKTDELKRQLVALAEAQNTKAGGGTEIPATFLRVTVKV
jgi:hypothetical protein